MNKLEQALLKRHSSELSSAFSGNGFNVTNGELSLMKSDALYSEEQLKEKKLIYPQMKNKKLLNMFRELRTSLNSEDGNNVILVTSIKPKSGVSFFASNLASVIALDNSKTALLLDCSLNESGISQAFELTGKPGVSDFVNNVNVQIEDVIHPVGLERLRVLPYGNRVTGSGEQFTHPRFSALLEEIKYRYSDRTIIIDAPSISNSADTRILMNYCDKVIIVSPYGGNDLSDIELGAKTIGQEKLAGVVFNDYWS